jgi:hypothetical protein
MTKEIWPELSYDKGKETYETIHLWSQIVGKVKLTKMPWINHSWHVTLAVTPLGLTTGDLYSNGKHFQISIDFLNHQLEITTSKNEVKKFDLSSLSVKGCYKNILESLAEMNIEVSINPLPNEVENPILFNEDDRDTYDPEIASALHLALLNSNKVFTEYRAGFKGKCSPVHFFWGSFDLAVSRFSGRKAPPHPGGIPNLPDWIAREAYSHEVCSCGFWPGSIALPEAAFYTYIYPEPEEYNTATVSPESAYYHKDLKEFILPYNKIYKTGNTSELLLDFLQSTYNAAADLANWDKKSLEFELKR